MDDPVESRSLSWVADMDLVCAGLARVAPETLQERPAGVTAQFVITKGELSTETFTPIVWDYEQTLSGRPFVRNLAHRFVLTLENLVRARFIAVNFDPKSPPTILEIVPDPSTSIARIEVANSCQDNPLEWAPFPAPVPDEDSKWFFELLDQGAKAEIRKRLDGQPLPIPRPTDEQGAGGPGSSNCIPNRAQAAFIDLPDSIEVTL